MERVKRGRGRPPKDPSERRTNLGIRVPPILLVLVKNAAQEDGTTVSQLVETFIGRGLAERERRVRRDQKEVAA